MPVKTAALALGALLTIFLSACGSTARKAEAQVSVPEQTPTVAVARAVFYIRPRFARGLGELPISASPESLPLM
jgi:hypothetical protein